MSTNCKFASEMSSFDNLLPLGLRFFIAHPLSVNETKSGQVDPAEYEGR